jgi:hypothetical protein
LHVGRSPNRTTRTFESSCVESIGRHIRGERTVRIILLTALWLPLLNSWNSAMTDSSHRPDASQEARATAAGGSDSSDELKALEAARIPPPLERVGVYDADPVEVADPNKASIDATSLPVVTAGELLPSGHRRVQQTVRFPISPQKLEQWRAAGKPLELDPQTGQAIRETFADFLPADWRTGTEDGERIDSYGNPIVNQTPGLPDWSQPDVDALRAAIRAGRETRAQQAAAGGNLRETDGVLANFIGQAIVRRIAIDDLVDLNDPALIDEDVAQAVIGYMHFYENLKFIHADDGRYLYSPTVYPGAIESFVEAHGASLLDVLAIEPPEDGGMRGGAPSGCYSRTAFARGMTDLSGQTDIWVANGFDDESADISNGLSMFFFYDCQDTGNNDAVRVSTNGYITFFQQGGGAVDGINFTNDPIPDSADTPNGYAAPWWDDLIVATNQGSTDRVSYKTEGAVDSRVFTVEWISISHLNGSTGDYHYFQVKLFETTDVIELHFGLDTSAWSTDAADSATTGIENYSGAGGDCGPNCLNTNNPPPPNDYRFTPFPRPENDNCGNAIELINGASVIGNLHRASPDGNADCGDSSNNRDVWYTFVARCNGTLHADTCGSRDIDGSTTGVDTVLSVHSGCPGTIANQLACSDDAGAGGCADNDSAVSVAMVAGQRVFIRVTHFGDIAFRFQSGAFRLNLNFASSNAPSNNNCASAIPILNGNTLIGNLLCASNDGSADCGSSATNPDIWYQFTAGASPGTLRLSMCGTRNNAGTDTGPDTALSVHSSCPGTIGNELSCNDDGFIPGCNTLDSRLFIALAPNENVKIRVTHFGDNAFRVGNGVTVLHADFGCAAPCTGDLNFDGQVSLADLAFLLAHFGTCHPSPLYEPGADLNCDSCVSLQDLATLLSHFGTTCP